MTFKKIRGLRCNKHIEITRSRKHKKIRNSINEEMHLNKGLKSNDIIDIVTLKVVRLDIMLQLLVVFTGH